MLLQSSRALNPTCKKIAQNMHHTKHPPTSPRNHKNKPKLYMTPKIQCPEPTLY